MSKVDKGKNIEVLLNEYRDSIDTPYGFEARVLEKSKVKHEEVKRNRVGLKRRFSSKMIVTMLSIMIIISTGVIAAGVIRFKEHPLLSMVKNEKFNMDKLIEKGYAKELNLSSENNGIKVTLDKVLSDEFVTKIQYNIIAENGKKYFLDARGKNYKKINFEGEFEEDLSIPERFRSVYKSEWRSHTEEGVIGSMDLFPIKEESGEISIEIPQLFDVDSGEMVKGDWKFEFHVDKVKSRRMNIDKEINEGELSVKIGEMIIAPSVTLVDLEYSYNDENIKSAEIEIRFDERSYGRMFMFNNNSYEGYAGLQSIFLEDEKDGVLMINSIQYEENQYEKFYLEDIKNNEEFEFKYRGNRLVVKDIDIGKEKSTLILEDYMDGEDHTELNINIKSRDGVSGKWLSIHGDNYVWDKIYRNDEGKEVSSKELWNLGLGEPLKEYKLYKMVYKFNFELLGEWDKDGELYKERYGDMELIEPYKIEILDMTRKVNFNLSVPLS